LIDVFCPSLIYFHPFSSIFIHFHPFSSIFIHFDAKQKTLIDILPNEFMKIRILFQKGFHLIVQDFFWPNRGTSAPKRDDWPAACLVSRQRLPAVSMAWLRWLNPATH
jgi:hypothetical protein